MQLLQDCQPATFGKGKEEVFDEEHRKAGKMDVTDFCTNFNLVVCLPSPHQGKQAQYLAWLRVVLTRL